MKDRRKTPLAIRADYDEHGALRWQVYLRATSQPLAYYRAQPRRGYHGRTQLSRALDAIQIEE